MGNNNLYKIENTLRSIAKRCKTVKYSLGLAILFLMLGGSAFSEEINNESIQNTILTREEIASSKENLKNSVGNLQSKVDSARAENQKTLKGLRLELIQLMEQGDQVVKSPWASWQFGLNYMYSKWNGAYKGKGDKAEKYPFEGVFTRSTNFFERVVSPLSEKYEELVTSTNPYDASSNARNGLGSGYGLASTEEKQEPIVTIEINAAIKPKSIQKNPISLDFIPPKAPTVTEPDINQALAPSLSLPEPKAPSKQISIVKPNASPFTGFFFNANNNDINLKTTTDHTSLTVENFKDVDSKTLYAGIDPNSVRLDPKNGRPALKTGAYEGNNFSGSLITEHAKRPTNILYRSGSKLSNLTFFVRGYFGDGSDGYIDAGSGHSGGSDTLGGPTLGTIGVHTLLDTKVENVKAYLYGRAGFLTSETWRNGKVKMTNTKVDVYGKENSVFYIMPSAWGTISEGYTSAGRRNYYIGSLEGTTNVNLYGSGNNCGG
ncbi:autotransporter-associated N-terminal domain-containing protein [Fusobacterium nucleatum]|uniref:autotransporter-associated N-terminal domain-containing protein n=1 Tax=Fusobacterium nucleatum TaxID=851 RepID=UPI0030D58396